jgi:hypothetical protein
MKIIQTLLSPRKLLRAAALVVAGIAFQWPTQHAVQAQTASRNICSQGAALTNPMAADLTGRGGIGGTGITVQAEPGVGGMGGTGIVGVITGFASICVNDVEVHLDAKTPVTDNGVEVSAGTLAVGQVVAVRASGFGKEVMANRVALVHVAVGPVDSMNAATGEFTVLGQTARTVVTGETSKLVVGNWVRVSGYREAGGQIAASHVEPVPPQAQAQLVGVVERTASQTLVVSGTAVRSSDAQSVERPTVGTEVLVTGSWDGKTLLAQKFKSEPTQQFIGAVERVVYEGYVHALGNRTIDLGRGALRMNDDMKLDGDNKSSLAVNQLVRITGRVGSDKQVRIERTEVFMPGARPASGQSTGLSEKKSDDGEKRESAVAWGPSKSTESSGGSEKSSGSEKSAVSLPYKNTESSSAPVSSTGRSSESRSSESRSSESRSKGRNN